MEQRKNIFRAAYKGPKGKHLSCLTETSLYGDYKPENQKSIHPYGGKRRKKVKKQEAA